MLLDLSCVNYIDLAVLIGVADKHLVRNGHGGGSLSSSLNRGSLCGRLLSVLVDSPCAVVIDVVVAGNSEVACLTVLVEDTHVVFLREGRLEDVILVLGHGNAGPLFGAAVGFAAPVVDIRRAVAEACGVYVNSNRVVGILGGLWVNVLAVVGSPAVARLEDHVGFIDFKTLRAVTGVSAVVAAEDYKTLSQFVGHVVAVQTGRAVVFHSLARPCGVLDNVGAALVVDICLDIAPVELRVVKVNRSNLVGILLLEGEGLAECFYGVCRGHCYLKYGTLFNACADFEGLAVCYAELSAAVY